MDIILSVLILIVLLLTNLIITKNRKKFNKVKNIVYTSLLILIVILFILFLTNKSKRKMENYQEQNGGTNKINKLLDMCELPNNRYTRHCFRDNTHQTCCKLSPSVRRYADSTQNQIGKLSEEAYKEYLRQKNRPIPTDKELAKMSTPWCTCLGAQVCKNYKFKDGKTDNLTNIKFINDKQSKNIVMNPLAKCEKFFSDLFLTNQHRTPGVENSGVSGSNQECNADYLKKKKNIN